MMDFSSFQDAFVSLPPPPKATDAMVAILVFGAPCGARWWTYEPHMEQLCPGALEACVETFARRHRPDHCGQSAEPAHG